VKLEKKLAQLKMARRNKKLTLRTLENKVGVSRQALSAYERGEYPPGDAVWDKLKKVLGLEGEVSDWWGRSAHSGKSKMYHDGDRCRIKGCDDTPVSKGLCRRHYQRVRYYRKTYGYTPRIEET
jgi:DNA-binding XRE family transcriptional regulator